VPTHGETFLFLREYHKLSPERQNRFREALGHLLADLVAIEDGLMNMVPPGTSSQASAGKSGFLRDDMGTRW